MPLPPVAETNRVIVTLTNGSYSASNRFYVFSPDPNDPGDIDSIHTIFRTWWSEDLSVWICNDFYLANIEVTDVSVVDGININYPELANAVPGASGDAPMSLNSAMTVTLQTPYAGKSRRGRIYQAGLPETMADVAQWTAEATEGISESYANLNAALGAGDWHINVVSFFSGGSLRVTPLSTPVTSFRANRRVYSQRRRTKPD